MTRNFAACLGVAMQGMIGTVGKVVNVAARPRDGKGAGSERGELRTSILREARGLGAFSCRLFLADRERVRGRVGIKVGAFSRNIFLADVSS